jgi:prepilin-type N-terminal cleavage/methylation domain-containing protein
MLNKLKKSNSEKGFTIIEVMIVLAIAGLILLIVFLAVPALQRSSRNTQRKNDAAAMAGSVANYISNNNGSLPASVGKNASTSILEVCTGGGAAVGGSAVCTGNVEQAKLGFFLDSGVHVVTIPAAGTTFTSAAAWAAGSVTVDTATIALKGTCDTATAGKVNYSSRSAVIVFATETGSGNGTVQCTEQ